MFVLIKRAKKIFRDLSLAKKVGFGILGIFLVVASVFIGLSIIEFQLRENFNSQIERISRSMNELQELRAEHIRWKVNFLTNLLNEDYNAISPDTTIDKLKKYRKIDGFEVSSQVWTTLDRDSSKMNELVLEMKKAKSSEELFNLYSQFQEYSRRFLWEGLEKLIEEYRKFLELKQTELKKLERIFKASYFVILIFVLAVVMFGSRFIGKRLEKELDKALQASKEIAKGNFRVALEIERKDEIGAISRALEEIKTSFNEIILNIKELGDRIKPVVESFKVLGETSSAKSLFIEMRIEEVLVEVDSILKDLEEQSNLLSQMKQAVDEINRTVLYTSNVANKAMDQALETQKLITTLEKASAEIEGIVKFIREVAEQTNLLALNASIEAARAGEVGKGFAVVANEVKELARQTDQAGVEITKKIKAIQNLHTSIITTVENMISIFREVKDYANTVASAVEEQTITLANIESQAQVHKERAEATSKAYRDLQAEYKLMAEDIQKNINFAIKLEEIAKALISSIEHFQTFEIDRRNFKRLNLSEDISLEFECNKKSFSGILRDLSMGGAFIISDFKPELNSPITVRLKTDYDWVEFEGTVVRVEEKGFGLKITEIHQTSLSKLKALLAQIYPSDLIEKEETLIIRNLRGTKEEF